MKQENRTAMLLEVVNQQMAQCRNLRQEAILLFLVPGAQIGQDADTVTHDDRI